MHGDNFNYIIFPYFVTLVLFLKKQIFWCAYNEFYMWLTETSYNYIYFLIFKYKYPLKNFKYCIYVPLNIWITRQLLTFRFIINTYYYFFSHSESLYIDCVQSVLNKRNTSTRILRSKDSHGIPFFLFVCGYFRFFMTFHRYL